MHKLLRLQSELLQEIDKYEKIVTERDHFIDWERVHIISCAKLGYLMGQERGVDPILAASACAIHDYGRIITGKQAGHAEAGYLPVKDFLKKINIFTKEEIEILSMAVKNHSNKSEVGETIEEIVKDADVLDFYQYGYEMPRVEQKVRLERLLGGKVKI